MLQVFVDGVMQLSIDGAFADGSMAFYNFSQADVTYSAFTVERIGTVPEPGTVMLLGSGLLLVGGVAARRRR